MSKLHRDPTTVMKSQTHDFQIRIGVLEAEVKRLSDISLNHQRVIESLTFRRDCATILPLGRRQQEGDV